MWLLGTSRHRLPSNLPLSLHRPFMVELFTPPDLLEYPSLVFWPGSDCHQPKAPHSGER